MINTLLRQVSVSSDEDWSLFGLFYIISVLY
jgi:hypothetical protein